MGCGPYLLNRSGFRVALPELSVTAPRESRPQCWGRAGFPVSAS